MPQLFDDSALAAAAHILTRGPISRADTARDLNLSPATLTRLVRPLLEHGFVTETSCEVPRNGMGRPPQLLDVPRDANTFIGINLTASTIYYVLTDTHARILTSGTIPIHNRNAGESELQIRELIASLIGNPNHAPVAGVGISLGGKITNSMVEVSRFLEWNNVSLEAAIPDLEEQARPIVEVLNDLDALTLLEQWFGLGRDCSDFAVLTVGAGIGHGMVHNLRTVNSPLHGLGPTSHIPLAGSHGVCQYGHVGCANGAITVPAVLSRARAGRAITREATSPNSVEELLTLAELGDKPSQRALSEFAENLSIYIQTVASAALVLDIVLDGEGVALLDSPWTKSFGEHLDAFSRPGDPVFRVHRRSGEFERWAQGAAVAAIVRWLENAVREA